MKVHEVSIMVRNETMRKQARKKQLKLWKVSVLLLVIGLGIGYIAGYEPAKPMYPPYRYEVKPGDTLWDVASMYGKKDADVRETYWKIAEDNHVHDGDIQPGQILLINR